MRVSEFPRLASVLHYGNVRQLHKYHTVLHDAQLLMLRRQLLRDAGRHLLDRLQQMHTNDRSATRQYTSSEFLWGSGHMDPHRIDIYHL